jgi:hypothetical protein
MSTKEPFLSNQSLTGAGIVDDFVGQAFQPAIGDCLCPAGWKACPTRLKIRFLSDVAIIYQIA